MDKGIKGRSEEGTARGTKSRGGEGLLGSQRVIRPWGNCMLCIVGERSLGKCQSVLWDLDAIDLGEGRKMGQAR